MYPQQTSTSPHPTEPRRYIFSWQGSSDTPSFAPESTQIPQATNASQPQQIRCFRRESSAIPRFAASRKTSPAGCGWQSSASRAKNALKSFFCFLGRFLIIRQDPMRSRAARLHAAGLGSPRCFPRASTAVSKICAPTTLLGHCRKVSQRTARLDIAGAATG